MSMYTATVPQTRKTLLNLAGWLELAISHATEKGYDPDVLLSARLAPDMFTLTRQVQSATDAAKFAASRLAGRTPPSHPDTENSFEQLLARVQDVVGYLDTIAADDFKGAGDRTIALPFMAGKGLSAGHYLNQLALPNFYFHVSMTYAILRHNGVPLGKRNFLGHLDLIDV
jgi:uncharacterized protein